MVIIAGRVAPHTAIFLGSIKDNVIKVKKKMVVLKIYAGTVPRLQIKQINSSSLAHGRKLLRSSLNLESGCVVQINRLYIIDRTTHLKFLNDTGTNVFVSPVSKADKTRWHDYS